MKDFRKYTPTSWSSIKNKYETFRIEGHIVINENVWNWDEKITWLKASDNYYTETLWWRGAAIVTTKLIAVNRESREQGQRFVYECWTRLKASCVD